MSKSQSPHKGNTNTMRPAKMLGIGAVIIGTLAGCGNASSPATATPAPVQNTANNGAATQMSEPSVTSVPATTESTQAPTSAQAPAATQEPSPVPPTATPASSGEYKDGEYVGDAVPADRWGDLQVRATIQDGQLVKIDLASFPHSTRRSDLISHAALPTLISEAIQNQSAQVDVVSRATDTSFAFTASLESALNAAATSKP